MPQGRGGLAPGRSRSQAATSQEQLLREAQTGEEPMTDAVESAAGTLGSGERAVAGDIAARIDRLPLTRIQYRYAAITQWFWGIMIAADGLVASLYPFVWAPKGLITSFQFDLILGSNIGVGILIGEYIGGVLARASRREEGPV